MSPIAVYIGSPSWVSKCKYCSANSYAGSGCPHEAYVKGLGREIALVGDSEGDLGAATVYVGGGTPTMLSVGLVAGMFQT